MKKHLLTSLQITASIIIFLSFSACKKDKNSDSPWTISSSMQTSRYSFGFVECNGLLYAVGGYNSDALNSVEVYDPANDTWQSKASMPTARGYLVVASVDNKIYAIGGVTGKVPDNISYTYVNEEYDPQTDSWTNRDSIPIISNSNSILGNQFICSSVINGKIIVAGYAPNNDIYTYTYDPTSDTWDDSGEPIPEFNFKPFSSTAIGIEMYVTNGEDFLKYRSDLKDWVTLPSSITERSRCSLVSYDDIIYSIGGYNPDYEKGSRTVTAIEIYNISNSSWTATSPLNIPRQSAGAVYYNGSLYVAGGSQSPTNIHSHTPLSSLEVLKVN